GGAGRGRRVAEAVLPEGRRRVPGRRGVCRSGHGLPPPGPAGGGARGARQRPGDYRDKDARSREGPTVRGGLVQLALLPGPLPRSQGRVARDKAADGERKGSDSRLETRPLTARG